MGADVGGDHAKKGKDISGHGHLPTAAGCIGPQEGELVEDQGGLERAQPPLPADERVEQEEADDDDGGDEGGGVEIEEDLEAVGIRNLESIGVVDQEPPRRAHSRRVGDGGRERGLQQHILALLPEEVGLRGSCRVDSRRSGRSQSSPVALVINASGHCASVFGAW